MADVGVLFSRLAATTLSDRSQTHARAGEKRIASSRNDWRDAVTAKSKAIGLMRLCLLWFLSVACFCVTSCATTSHHKFSDPTTNWQTKSGQLMYRTTETTLIGDVLVRFSKSRDFELSLSKGPVTLLTLRQNASFAEVKGPFAKGGWSGPVEQAPKPLRAWLGLRDKLISSQDRSVRYTAGNETFLFRF
jgi:hypothetical protein